MNEEQKLKVEEFFKNRPPMNKPIVQKTIADRPEGQIELKHWIQELSARIAKQPNNPCNSLSIIWM